ncbi:MULTISPECIES: ABC transporter permease [Caldilinea]|jgi:peptide/nickel transport system permease protein|uniref:Putative ABC transporter permease protein n=1 Tax=Caldilinea aerophila (strain DSM 14535 / JCM 11387 / NBRC 104270 / STL-6-O1) TaxID=926550 RepID=I0I1M5_CALAS|nr:MULTISPECIES: ABC transporter permease [Caldilinea]BAL99162.1 putative ABC transporter permease protein [Caldilinea aerophila DSM 14535 = NBRC 104270]GIV74247.1 MAG: peptide ABC transporter permease [Caldilinea sp.]
MTAHVVRSASIGHKTPKSRWGETPWRRTLRRFSRHQAAVLALFFLFVLLLCAIAPQWIAPYDPLAINMQMRLHPPSPVHLLGTDDFGRDILSRLIYGSRISLQVGLISVAISAIFGITIGIFAGYFGGFIDTLLMLLMDILFAFPAILLAIAIMAVLGTSTMNVMIAVGIVYIPVFARIVRGVTLELRVQDYVDAARAIGAKPHRILLRHILPGTFGILTVQVTLSLAFAILAEAALSFLGLGVQPPAPSWGSMLSFGREWVREAPWFSFFPGMAIFMTVLSLNLVGDGWRDALDPRL